MGKKIAAVLLAAVTAGCGCSGGLYEDTFVAAGTYVTVISDSPEAAKIVHREFTRLSKMCNVYIPDSDISRVNNGEGKPVSVPPELCELILLSKSAGEATNGYFDISQGILYRRWKECCDRKDEKCALEKDTLASLRVDHGIDSVIVDTDRNTVTITDRRVALDLSGIAKGFMGDKACRALKNAGVTGALIDAGGDLYCLGDHPDGSPWVVGIQDPLKKRESIYPLELSDNAAATSGNYERFFDADGVRYSHVIDPLTGYPVPQNMLSVTVIAHNATTADAFATAFLCMSVEEIREFLNARPTTLQVYAVTGNEQEGVRVHVFK